MSMKTRLERVAPMLILLAAMTGAEGKAVAAEQSYTRGTTLHVGKDSRVWLEGDSTVHRFNADATQFRADFVVDSARGPAEPQELIQAGRVKNLTIEIPVKTLRSGDTGLDENMVKALKGPDHPVITFHMDSYQALPEPRSDQELRLKLHGRLQIAGVEKSIELEAQATRTGSGLKVVGSKQLLMSEYGVQPPVLMFGMLKVKDTIVVRFSLDLQSGN
jgi:hypothetical protein